MVFRPNYPFQMYPGPMRMPMQMPMQMHMPMQMPMQMPMSPQSFLPPGGFPFQPRIPGGLQMAGGLGALGSQIPGAGAGANAAAAAGAAMQQPSKIASFLQSADSLFNSAKTYTPYIQQAMPMMKNIPSLFKLYKGFQGLPDADAAAGTAAVASAATAAKQSRSSQRSSNQSIAPVPREPVPSRPRIFQPPM